MTACVLRADATSSHPTLADSRRPLGRGLALLLAGLSLFGSLVPRAAHAEADTLGRGELSIGLFEAAEQYNRYWYHYNGVGDCFNEPCSRFNFNSYDAVTQPLIAGVERPLDTARLFTTGLRAEVGVLSRLTLAAETQLVLSPGGSPSAALGDSRLGLRWKMVDGPLIVSLAGAVKLPGTYAPNSLVAPGDGQTDVEARLLLGGLVARRRLFYDVGVGYRLRLSYASPVSVALYPISYASSVDTTGTPDSVADFAYAVTGPADEVFLDGTLGFYPTRRLLLYANLAAVNSTKGLNLDDYYLTVDRASAVDSQGRPVYALEGDASQLFMQLQQDHVRVGVGLLFKAFFSTTVYLNYSMVAVGQNTPAFYVKDGSSFPLGTFMFGLESTFSLRKTPTLAPSASLPEAALGRRLAAL